MRILPNRLSTRSKNQKNAFKASIRVTPGTPPIAETRSDTELTGIATLVSEERRFTAASEKKPEIIPKTLFRKGCSAFAQAFTIVYITTVKTIIPIKIGILIIHLSFVNKYAGFFCFIL